MNKGNITRRFVQVLNRMVRYWPSSAFTFWWTQMELRYIKKEKRKQEREKGQYSAILTEQACSIKDNLHDKKIIPRFVTIEEIHETRCGFLAQSVERRVWGRNHWVHTSLDWTNLPSSSTIQLYHPALPSSSTIQLSRCNSNETGRSKREVFPTKEENDLFFKVKRNHWFPFQKYDVRVMAKSRSSEAWN